MRENIGADIALCQVRMRFPERFGRKIAGISEHPFQFGPFFVLDITGLGPELLEQVILSDERMQQHIGIDLAARPPAGFRDESLPLIVSGAEDHQECPDILAEDFAHLRDT